MSSHRRTFLQYYCISVSRNWPDSATLHRRMHKCRQTNFFNLHRMMRFLVVVRKLKTSELSWWSSPVKKDESFVRIFFSSLRFLNFLFLDIACVDKPLLILSETNFAPNQKKTKQNKKRNYWGPKSTFKRLSMTISEAHKKKIFFFLLLFDVQIHSLMSSKHYRHSQA